MTIDSLIINKGSLTKSYLEQITSFCEAYIYKEPSFRVHTSGSTGRPKEIILKRSQIQASALKTIKHLGLSSDDIALICLAPESIAAKMMMVRCIEADMKAFIVSPSANPLINIPTKSGITFAAFVPYQIASIIEQNDPRYIQLLEGMKNIILGGEAISNSLNEKLKQFTPQLYHTYGMTETVSHIAMRRINGADVSDSFYLLPDIEIKTDERGCLQIRADVTDRQWITTNDLVSIESQNTFKFIGRIDRVINSGGIKIHPEELEASISSILVDKLIDKKHIVLGVPDQKLNQKVVWIVENSNPWSDNELAEIKKQLHHNLPRYHCPKDIYTLPSFSLTATDKVDRQATFKALVDYLSNSNR